MIRNKCIRLILFCGILLVPLTILSEISQEVITLEADNVNYDYKNGVIYYAGNVLATQGPSVLTANEMFVYYNHDHKIKKIIAIGKLAHYKTLVNDDKDILKAQAIKISYYPLCGKITLDDQAQVDYNNNHFSGPYIYYDMIKKVIASHPKRHTQSKIILEPIKNLKTQLK
jgi:lipopolysaccharide export system protein LptA